MLSSHPFVVMVSGYLMDNLLEIVRSYIGSWVISTRFATDCKDEPCLKFHISGALTASQSVGAFRLTYENGE